MINDDKTGWSAGPRVAVGTLCPCGHSIVLPISSFSQHLSHFSTSPSVFAPSFFTIFSACYPRVLQQDRWRVCDCNTHSLNTHTAWTDGAAWSVWQITLLVVRPNPMPTAPHATKRPLWRELNTHTATETVSYILKSSTHVPCMSYLYPRLSVWPPKTSKHTFKTKASKYKVLCINCHTRHQCLMPLGPDISRLEQYFSTVVLYVAGCLIS